MSIHSSMLLYVTVFWLLLNRTVKSKEETTLRRERGRESAEDWSWDLTSGRKVQLCMSLLQAMHWHSYAKLFCIIMPIIILECGRRERERQRLRCGLEVSFFRLKRGSSSHYQTSLRGSVSLQRQC